MSVLNFADFNLVNAWCGICRKGHNRHLGRKSGSVGSLLLFPIYGLIVFFENKWVSPVTFLCDIDYFLPWFLSSGKLIKKSTYR